jgi:hypothetical protein
MLEGGNEPLILDGHRCRHHAIGSAREYHTASPPASSPANSICATAAARLPDEFDQAK